MGVSHRDCDRWPRRRQLAVAPRGVALALAVAEVQLAAGWQLATRCPPGTGLRHPWPPHLSGYFCPPADPASEADSAPPSGTFPTSPAPRSSPIGVLALAAKNFRLTTSMAPTPAPGTFFFPSLHDETWFKGPAFHHVIALLRSMGHPYPLLIVAPGSSVSSHWPLSAGALAHAQPTRTYRYQLILLSAHHLTSPSRPSPIITSPSLSVRLSVCQAEGSRSDSDARPGVALSEGTTRAGKRMHQVRGALPTVLCSVQVRDYYA